MDLNSVSDTDPNWLVHLATNVGLTLAGVSVFLLLQLLVMRGLAGRDEARANHFRTRWQPILAETLFDSPTFVPPLRRSERYYFLVEWNRLFDMVQGDVTPRLVHLATQVRIDIYAGELLLSGSAKQRLLALVTLGHLRIPGYWPILLAISTNDSPVVSLAAARGLLQMDAEKGVEALLRIYGKRDDWPIHWVAKLLYEVGPDATSIALASAVRDASEANEGALVSRLVKLLPTAHAILASPTAVFVLETCDDDNVVKDCLHVLNDPTGLELARNYLKHSKAHVRMSAVLTLGRLGLPTEVPLIVATLNDSEWWVRYRAAQALVSMPNIGNTELDQLDKELEGQLGQDVLRHVRAENLLN